MKAAPLIYLPISIFGHWFKQDLSDIVGEKAYRVMIILRYLIPLVIAAICLVYPLVYFKFQFENGFAGHFRGEAFLAGNLNVPETIVRIVLVYGYALFIALVFYVKNWWLKALYFSFFIFYIYWSIHNDPVNVLLSMRASISWYILLFVTKDFLNGNYKHLKYNSDLRIVFLEKENKNVSTWRAGFLSAIIIAIELFAFISLFYGDGGAI